MSRRVVWFTWDVRPTLTFRRHLPVWVGRVRPYGMYARVGTHSRGFVLMPPLTGS
jgi:hypothetical protein